jgi:hypothetical protein
MVPVVDRTNKPLMPCKEKRARKLMERGEAVSFWKRGVFCLKLVKEPSDGKNQKIACGIDPGSKREGYTVATQSRVVLNVLTDTPYWVKDAKKIQKEMRNARRGRKTPCRKPRSNNKQTEEFLPPSTKSRWQAKLRILRFLSKIIPITDVIVEDIGAEAKKGKKKWNRSFSPLEVGKNWFYDEVESDEFNLHIVKGYDTKTQRDKRGFKKTGKKLAETWSAHNVDSHSLVEILFGGNIKPFLGIQKIFFLRLHRRQLHRFEPKGSGIRKNYGGTRSLGFRRGSLVAHTKYGFCYIGGCSDRGLSLHLLETGKRFTQRSKVQDCRFLTYLSWRYAFARGKRCS